MAIANFVPEIWSAALLEALRSQLVYAQGGVINRDYEGEIARAGDTVHIVNFDDPAVRTYTKNPGSGITWDVLTDHDQTLVVNQSDYFAFSVDDIDRRQALSGFVESATRGAAYGLASKTDTYLSGLMASAVPAGNQLGATPIVSTAPEKAYDMLVNLRTKLTRSNVPESGRFVVVPPELYAVLLHDDRFIRADASGTTAGLRNGQVGRAAGFDVFESNTVPEDTSGADPVYTVLAGHAMATTFAEQITSTEAIRLQTSFADGVRGLHLYGGKVIRPTALASAAVTVDASGA